MLRIVLLVCLAAALGGCSRASGDGAGEGAGVAPGPTRPGSGYAALRQNICRAADAAGRGDRAGAAAGFSDAHGALHELAAETAGHDRAAAGRLLEAKQRVESALGPGGADPGPDLRELAEATRQAVGAVEGTAPPGCP